ncbi:MAG: tRNA (N6-threonylcarbamoyladenosine(37)-N6)-methyltransferase TrmO [Oscillospiraceae bacterium]|nr:tRNA (N6-threonylcarbamoyladenosine(37)-N6)-methyltransferase TrmO [Oscillospiraceae bacterium]
MSKTFEIKQIAHIENDFTSKFGIPRQSGLLENMKSTIIFEPEFRDEQSLREIDDFSHLWLIWQFSESVRDGFSPTVRPPRLGGNRRVGVFATRSPFRPNSLGLSSVKLITVKKTPDRGTVLEVSGADLMNGTPIFDIKPYIAYSDSHPDAVCGFSDVADAEHHVLQVTIPPEIEAEIPGDKLENLKALLSLDPRPAYQDDHERMYMFEFGGMKIGFRVDGDSLTVEEVTKCLKSAK